jgi:outer membrane protein assembly factor BamB
MRICARQLCILLVCGLLADTAVAQQSRVLWRFRTEGRTTKQFITRGPEGTIYTNDDTATYALRPSGALRWRSFEAAGLDGGGGRPISLGLDGTVYTGVGIVGDEYALVVALNADGSTRWKFPSPTPGALLTGPNLGPDGNIYGVQDVAVWGGLGAFSLDPGGNLRWSNQADLSGGAGLLPDTNSQIAFGADRFHTGLVFLRSGGNPVIYTFSLGGDLLWTTWDLQPHTTSFPIIDPARRVLCTWGQTGMRALEPGGDQEWFSLHPNGASLVQRPAIDNGGKIYTGDLIGVDLWALNPDGTTRWVLPPEPDATLFQLGVSPDRRVIVAGGSSGPDQTGWVRGYAAATGMLLWQVNLPHENGMFQYVTSVEPAFSADSRVTYVTTQFAGDVNNYGYVLAIRTRAMPSQNN